MSNPSQDPLEGFGGPMTRARTRRMKQALQGLIMEVQAKEPAVDGLETMPHWVTYSIIGPSEEFDKISPCGS